MITPYFKSTDKNYILIEGDVITSLNSIDFEFDMIFADPPYFLSNDGLTIKNGKITSVNKGTWDKLNGFRQMSEFNKHWLQVVRKKMKKNATIWISGTYHNIFNIGQLLAELEFKILNVIIWEKTNPPPNFSKRYFTHSTEIIIWARKYANVPHYFNYDLMKKLNNGKQMKDVWRFPAVSKWEKECGKHPTQKPLNLLNRIILASSKENDWILDPFAGSCTTGIAANLLNRKFVGIDKEKDFLEIGKCRKLAMEKPEIKEKMIKRLNKF